jgi:hypothetical protein
MSFHLLDHHLPCERGLFRPANFIRIYINIIKFPMKRSLYDSMYILYVKKAHV